MCRLYVVVKLVLLKLLLASISGLTSLSAYEYGYHPSAEEFDGLLKDTHRTWTHDILNQQKQRELYKKSPLTTDVRTYVPKFQYENQYLQTFQQNQKRHDLQEYPSVTTSTTTSTSNTQGFVDNLGSTLNFHFNNNDDDDNDDAHDDVEHNTIQSVSGYDKPGINLKPLAKPHIENYSLNNIYNNNSHAHFPIYFTNPATGIVYSITEMGKSSQNLTSTNGSIPIFITKEQYERDILLLKQEYEQKCGLDVKTIKKAEILRPLLSNSTTMRPKIIRLQRPLSSAQSSIKYLTPLKKPSPVVVTKEIIVKDHKISIPRPLRKKPKQKGKKKIKKTKPPGHQNGGSTTTPRPNSLVLGTATWAGGPTIFKGTHTTTKRPYNDFYKLSTQLEKPNFGTTMFSTGVLPATASNDDGWNNRLDFTKRERNKRSLHDFTNLNDLDTNFKSADKVLSDSGVVIKQSKYKVNEKINPNFHFEFNFIENKNMRSKSENTKSVDFKNINESNGKFKNNLLKSDERFKTEKNLVSKTENILVNFSPDYQNADKKKWPIMKTPMDVQGLENLNPYYQNDDKMKWPIMKTLIGLQNLENLIPDYQNADTKKWTIRKTSMDVQNLENFNPDYQNFDKNKWAIMKASMDRQNKGISETKFKENLEKLLKVGRVNFVLESKSNLNFNDINKLNKSKSYTLSSSSDNSNILQNEFKEKLEKLSKKKYKSLKLIKKNYEKSQNFKNFNKAKTELQNSDIKISKSTKGEAISDKLDLDIEDSNKINEENFQKIVGNLKKPTKEIETLQQAGKIMKVEKINTKNHNQSEVLQRYSKSKDFDSKHNLINKKSNKIALELIKLANIFNLGLDQLADIDKMFSPTKEIRLNSALKKDLTNTGEMLNKNKSKVDFTVIDKKLSSKKGRPFNNSLKKDLQKPKELYKNKAKVIKYPIKKELNNKKSENFKYIVKNISIPKNMQLEKSFIHELKAKEVQLVKSANKSDKYSNKEYVNIPINIQSLLIDKNKVIPRQHLINNPIAKGLTETQRILATSERENKARKKNMLKVIKFSHNDAIKSTNPNESVKIPKNLMENELHYIRKRSVAENPSQNVTAPKFVKKSYNSTAKSVAAINKESTIENKTHTPIKLKRLTGKNQTRLNSRFHLNSKTINSRNSTSAQKSSKVKKRQRNRPRNKNHNSRNRTKPLKNRKPVQTQTSENDFVQNVSIATNSGNTETSTTRNIKEAITKMVTRLVDNKRATNSIFGIEGKNEDEDDEEEDEDDDDNDDDDDDGEDSEEDDDYYNQNDLKEKPIRDNTSSAEEAADFGDMPEEGVTTAEGNTKASSNEYKESETIASTEKDDIKKRIRRRPTPSTKSEDDYDEEDDEDSSMGSNLGGFFRMMFYPVQMVMSSIMDSLLSDKEPEEQSVYPYPQYTSYHNTLKQHSSDDYSYDDADNDNDNNDGEDYENDSSESSLGGWISSWFGLNRRNKKISSTTVAPPSSAQRKPTRQSNNWFQSWFGIGSNDGIDKADAEDYDDYDKWFASWFGEIKPKARKRTTTTTTSTTTQLPQVPILTIVDPMRNPQNWIGILAHHIINQTSTTTQNPLRDIWTRITTPETTTTTTENPEIPRKISYNKYQIWRLKPQDDSQVQALEEYKKGDDGIKLQWLKGPSLRGLTDVLVPPRMLVDFQASLTFESIDHEVLIFDVGKAIAYEKSKEDYFFTTTQKPKKKHQNRYSNKPPTAMTWMRYYEFDDIVTFMESMRLRYPQLVELIHIGRSYEGRPLIVMKIESKEAAATNSAQYTMHEKAKLRHKKRIGLANAVFIEGGTHGMEWIAPATATWIINELLKVMKMNKSSSDEANLIRNTTWFIMPVLNPDGYVYSHEYDRFWKKSRSRHISRPSGLLNSAMTWLQKKKIKDRVCFGVDLDRNWNYQWGKRGSSKSPCNEFFAGPGPFSEPETKALSEFLMDYRTHIKLYISMQAYGQIISYPYKANTTYDTERLDDFLDVAMVGTDGLRKKGSKSRYKIDSTNDLVENRSGCSDAFVAYDVGIPFSYTLQLADNGVHGYLLPSSSIESTSRDAFEIITAMLDYI